MGAFLRSSVLVGSGRAVCCDTPVLFRACVPNNARYQGVRCPDSHCSVGGCVTLFVCRVCRVCAVCVCCVCRVCALCVRVCACFVLACVHGTYLRNCVAFARRLVWRRPIVPGEALDWSHDLFGKEVEPQRDDCRDQRWARRDGGAAKEESGRDPYNARAEGRSYERRGGLSVSPVRPGGRNRGGASGSSNGPLRGEHAGAANDQQWTMRAGGVFVKL
jgi:hypothetical protein